MSFNWQKKLQDQLDKGRNLVVAKYGAGKCKVTLSTVDKEVRGGYWGVVIAPKRNCHTWVQEIKKWSEKIALHYQEIGPTVDKPFKNLLVITPHQVEALHDQIVALEPRLVVLDESTVIKNDKAVITKTLLRLSRCCRYARKLALTGDPTPEKETELWTQMEFAYPGVNPLGRTFYQFLNRWFIKADWIWAMRLERREDFFTIFDQYTVRMDEHDWKEHAEVVGAKDEWKVVHYAASEEQLDLMERLKKEWSLPNDEGTEDEYWHTMSILQKSLQICNGFYYLAQLKRPRRLVSNPKQSALRQVVGDCLKNRVTRIVVWYAYTEDAHEIQTGLRGLVTVWDQESLSLFGTDPRRDPLVIALPQSYSRGINDLVVAPVDIFWSVSHSQELRNQAESRLTRPGQRSTVVTHIDLACPDLIDSKVVFALQQKDLTKDRCKAIVQEVFGDGPRYSKSTATTEG